jgi:hypothetical protein
MTDYGNYGLVMSWLSFRYEIHPVSKGDSVGIQSD